MTAVSMTACCLLAYVQGTPTFVRVAAPAIVTAGRLLLFDPDDVTSGQEGFAEAWGFTMIVFETGTFRQCNAY